MLGLPAHIGACLFDLDGVLTRTASVHFAAWKRMFDSYLRDRSGRTGAPFVEFGMEDYLEHVDGRPRADGVRGFLAARGISLPEGTEQDPATAETVRGLGNRKNELVLAVLERDGVEVFEGSRRYLHALRRVGLPAAVVSSSANAEAVLQAAGLTSLVDVVVDGLVALERGLPGKPRPDTFVAAAALLGVEVAAAAVFEDAIAGVAAGRAGDFGFVVGVDRAGQAEALAAAGADRVVEDLEELLA
jgi:beta-phosphoglucomutase family hydrolase